MNQPTPAIVTQREVKRLPRLALLLMCAAYILPGLFGRDPWRPSDSTAFGYMYALAEGHTSWLAPELLGNSPDGGLIPYWLGAAFIKLLPFLDAPTAARIPFALLLAAIFLLTWYACYYLARTEPAQPIAFAFGGEANPKDYARAIADGALLALMATIGLLQPGHETTPELVQMGCITFFFFALAAAPYKTVSTWICAACSLPVLALSGGPVMAVVLGIAAAVMCANSEYEKARPAAAFFILGVVLSVVLSWLTNTWGGISIYINSPLRLLLSFMENAVWFTWPVWPFLGWTLWHWRYLWRRRHISGPLVVVVVAVLGCLFSDGDKNYLLYALPAMAVLAAFAMPTFKRSVSALIDWFALILFTLLMLVGWFYWFAMSTGYPATPSAKVLRLVPGYTPEFALLPFIIALLATIAWLWLVRWRTGRHPHAIWKGMVLSAGGVTLCWLMLMTLGLNVMDYARSFRPWTARIEQVVTASGTVPECLSTQNLSVMQIATWSWQPGIPLRAETANCPYLIVNAPSNAFIPFVDKQRWELDDNGIVIRPSDRTLQDRVLIYRLHPDAYHDAAQPADNAIGIAHE
ncbi:hypothetical protein CUZ56_00694 [Saezia sanguinis]|uniref:Inner membrane transmembrane protein n=1 Tax=Saezia sanguinis TaxID=1965230 RepID=A0A433SHH3_9BURK|nr:hypothetical protein [Saezia sanguinis]RUS68207.1 hypothetical protein CUZ56_00694 [Saezia sanguinis]